MPTELELARTHLVSTVFNHWRVWDWATGKIDTLSRRADKHHARTIAEFWSGVLSGRYKHGDLVRGKDWFLTDWCPKMSGHSWAVTERFGLPELHHNSFLSDQPHYILELNHGAVRLMPTRNPNRCALLTLVDEESWRCERGVPIVVSPQVYSAFLQRRIRGKAVEVDFEARFLTGDLQPDFERFVMSVGVDVPSHVRQLLTTVLGVPKCYLELLSPIGVTMRAHDAHPIARISTVAVNEDGAITGLFAARVDPSSEEELREGTYLILQNLRRSADIHCVNDFDAMVPRIRCTLPVRIGSWTVSAKKRARLTLIGRLGD